MTDRPIDAVSPPAPVVRPVGSGAAREAKMRAALAEAVLWVTTFDCDCFGGNATQDAERCDRCTMLDVFGAALGGPGLAPEPVEQLHMETPTEPLATHCWLTGAHRSHAWLAQCPGGPGPTPEPTTAVAVPLSVFSSPVDIDASGHFVSRGPGPAAAEPPSREQMLGEAIRQHDIAFGTDHCDRKYILSCSEMPGLILQIGTKR